VPVMQSMLLPDDHAGAGIHRWMEGFRFMLVHAICASATPSRVALVPALTSKEPTSWGALGSTAPLPTIPQPCTAMGIQEHVQHL